MLVFFVIIFLGDNMISLIDYWNYFLANWGDKDYTNLIDSFLTSDNCQYYLWHRSPKVLELIPEFIKYTYKSEFLWLENSELREIDGFLDAVKSALYETDFYSMGKTYSDFIERILKLGFYDEKITDHLLSIDLEMNDLLAIFRDVCRYGIKFASTFLDKLIKNREDINEHAHSLVLFINSGYYWNDCNGDYPIKTENINFFFENLNSPLLLYKNIREDDKLLGKINKYFLDNFSKYSKMFTPSNWSEIVKKINDRKLLDLIDDYLATNFDESSLFEEYFLNEVFDNLFVDCQKLPKVEKMRREYVEDYWDGIIDSIYEDTCYSSLPGIKQSDEDIKELKAMKDFLRIVFEEVCQNEKVTYGDIRLIGSGDYSNVYRVGNKVVKVGANRGGSVFPNNPYIVAPVLRKHYYLEGADENSGIFVEVTEYVDTLKDDEVSEEELYELYAKIRDLGLEWLDIGARNVGRLRHDNIIYWHDEIQPTDSSLGLSRRVGEDIVLKAGELVVLDSDYFYEEGKIPPRYLNALNNDYFGFAKIWKSFHKRYEQECNLKNKKAR